MIANVIADSLAAVATRLGVSAAILGKTSSAVTFGAGVVVFFAVDYMLDWVTSWFYNPVDNMWPKSKQASTM